MKKSDNEMCSDMEQTHSNKIENENTYNALVINIIHIPGSVAMQSEKDWPYVIWDGYRRNAGRSRDVRLIKKGKNYW